MINLLLSIVFLGCVGLIIKLWKDRNFYLSELIEQESKAKFWEKQYKGFSKDEAIEHERKLRKRFEKLYNDSLNNN
jgi:hypothetical protein